MRRFRQWDTSLARAAMAILAGVAACDRPDEEPVTLDAARGGTEAPAPDAALDLDRTAPVFDGLSSATPVGPDALELTWAAAEDETSPAERLNYRIYLATAAGAQDFVAPLTTATGVTRLTVTGLSPGRAYAIVVRAADEAGNEDENTVERTARTISDAPTSPPLAAVDLAGNPADAFVDGGALYLPLGDGGVQIVDLRAPDRPATAPAFDLGRPVIDVAADRVGGVLAALGDDGTVTIVDVVDPAAPRPLAVTGEGTTVSGAAVSGRRVAVFSPGLATIFAVGSDGAVTPAGEVDLPADVGAATGAPEGFYLGLVDGTLLSLDPGSSADGAPGAPAIRASATLPGPARRLRAADGLLVVDTGADTLGLWSVDGETPAVLGQIADAASARFDLSGRTLVVGRADGVVDTLDVSTPETPRLVTSDRDDEGPATWVAALPGAALFGAGTRARVLNTPPLLRAGFPAAGTAPRPGTPLDFALSEPVLVEGAHVEAAVDGNPVDGVLHLLDGGRRFRFTPREPIPAGARVTARLRGVVDLFGGRLAVEPALDVTVGEGARCVPGPEVCDGADDDCNGAVDENDVCRPARNPRSAFPHTVDGQVTGWTPGAAPQHEWADVQPAVGRYTYLYVDYDGERLHLFNDWHYMDAVVDPSCYNRFDVTTGDGAEAWEIRVYGDRRVEVRRNGEPVEGPLYEGTAGFGPSPQVPDRPHAAWELAFPVQPGAWNVALHDPGPTFNCAAGELATEPSRIAGALSPGGSTVLADARNAAPPPPAPKLTGLEPPAGAPGQAVRAVGVAWPEGPVFAAFVGPDRPESRVPAQRPDAAAFADFVVPEVPAGVYRVSLVFGEGSGAPRTEGLVFTVTGECSPRACGEVDCGTFEDGCGGLVDCGPCGGGERCGATLDCMETCGMDEACQAACEAVLRAESRGVLVAARDCLVRQGCPPGSAGAGGGGAFDMGFEGRACEAVCAVEIEACAADGQPENPGRLSCAEVQACFGACGANLCRRNCLHDATPAARAQASALALCAVASGCEGEAACRLACPDAAAACYGAAPGEPVLDGLEPGAGEVGTEVTAFARHMPDAPASVVFRQGGMLRRVIAADRQGGQAFRFLVPELEPGDYAVSLQSLDSETNGLAFVVEAAPCEPRACVPAAGDCGVLDDGCGGVVDCGPCGVAPRYGWRPMPWRHHPGQLSGRVACAAFSELAAGFVAGGASLGFSNAVYTFESDLPLVESTPLPVQVRNAAGAWVGDLPANPSARNALILGGEVEGEGTSDRAWLAAPVGAGWVEIGPMPRARRRADAVTLGGIVYLIGGTDALGAPITEFDAYVHAQGTWHGPLQSNLPPGTTVAATVAGNRIYALHRGPAGYALYGSSDPDEAWLGFEHVVDAPFDGVVDYRLVAEGRTPVLLVIDLFGRIWSYEVQTGVWADEPPLSEARMPACLISDAWGAVVAIGGYVHVGERALGKAERIGGAPGTNCGADADCGPGASCDPLTGRCGAGQP